VSLQKDWGGVNYCLKALIDIGHIKAGNFKKNPDKSVYLYLLTPKGISEKARLTAGFLNRKMAEYQALKKEIYAIQFKAKRLKYERGAVTCITSYL
jgi:MarR family transcriptional regulator, temperature-dependent positive regulator of motility